MSIYKDHYHTNTIKRKTTANFFFDLNIKKTTVLVERFQSKVAVDILATSKKPICLSNRITL